MIACIACIALGLLFIALALVGNAAPALFFGGLFVTAGVGGVIADVLNRKAAREKPAERQEG